MATKPVLAESKFGETPAHVRELLAVLAAPGMEFPKNAGETQHPDLPSSQEPANSGSVQQLISVLTRIADALETVVDVEKRTLRMVDVERGNVYKTHLGGKLSGEKAP